MGRYRMNDTRDRNLLLTSSRIAIYETTHHENLPALLDLSEANFDGVVVFLRALSYDNLSGQGSPEEQWPKTEFIIQSANDPNRVFIRRMFSFLKKAGIGNLHLSTLDNNLLFLATRLWFWRDLQVSLTVHEVNEYFASSFSSLRDVTENLAKILLHKRIRRHTFFLPAMADAFRQHLPGAVTVFIPSRFYDSPAPIASGKDSPFRVVIPGSVDANRREYEGVVAFFTRWLSRGASRPVELVILGDSDTPYGSGIVAQLQRLESSGFRLIHYKGYVPALVYEQQIRKADLLWSPLRVHKKSSRNSPEVYGLTTASGLTADLLLSNAPALTPAGFVLPEAFQAAQLSYGTLGSSKGNGSAMELEEVFDRLARDPGYMLELRQRIHSAFSFFVKKNFMASFRLLTGLGVVGLSSARPDQEGEKG